MQTTLVANIGAAWVHNPTLKGGTLLTMDSRDTVLQKGQYVVNKGLGGLFMWEIDADTGTILNAMNESVGNKRQ
mgnify:CR=1 FL=1